MQHQALFDGKYRILKTLGRGGTGSVFLAENVRLGTLWAIKEIHKRQGQAIHFLSEPHVLKNLRHPALPRIFDIIENEDYLYLIQDYIEGTPLDELIRQNGAIPAGQLSEWAIALCDVYRYLHGQQPNPIIYRDMKPGNLIVDQQGAIKVIDFGIAREFKNDSPTDTVCLGTRGYAAPEQYGASQTDARSDIYSLGVTLYHALTGKGPNDPPYELPALPETGNDAALNRIINKAVKADPEQRFQNAAEMHHVLCRMREDAASGGIPSENNPIRRGIAAGLALVGILFTLGGLKALLFTALSDIVVKTKGLLELIPGVALCGLAFWLWTGRFPWQSRPMSGELLELDGRGRLNTPLKRSMAFFSPVSTGKTELACNTALALAKLEKKVILLDLDHDSYGTVYNFPADPGEQGENYYKYRLLVRKTAGYLAGNEPEIGNEEIARMALWSSRNLWVYSGNQEIPLTEGGCSDGSLDPDVFRYLMRRFRTLADVVILDVGQSTPPELLEQIAALEDCSKYLVATENLKDLNTLAYRQRFPKDVDYEDWILVVNQCGQEPGIKDRELLAYFTNPELDWMKYKIRQVLRVPRVERLWALKWSRKAAYGACKSFDSAITTIIAAARAGA